MLDGDAPMGDALSGEETIWVRNAQDDELVGPSEQAVTEYVPRILVTRPPNLEEMRVRNQETLVSRAQAVLDLYGALSDDRTVAAVRRVTRSRRDEQLIMQCARVRYEARTVVRDGDQGRYADAICRTWNCIDPGNNVVVAAYIPLRNEHGKVVGDCFGRKWTLRPFIEATEPCVDPKVLGDALGRLHAASIHAHGAAEALMEIRPRPYPERVKQDMDSSLDRLATTTSARVMAVRNKLSNVDTAAIAALEPRWTHASFSSSTCRSTADGRLLLIEGIENSRLGTRLEDFYDLVLWDKTRSGIELGIKGFGVAARAYVAACGRPFGATECRLLPTVLWLRAAVNLASVVAELSSNQRQDRSGRKSLYARRRDLLHVLERLESSAEDLSAAAADANPKFIESNVAMTTRLLPPSSPEQEKEPEVATEATSDDPSGFWGGWAAKMRKAATKKYRLVSTGEFQNILQDCRIEVGESGELCVAQDVEVCRSGLREAERKTLNKPVCAACYLIHLERNARRAAHVSEHIRKIVPGARIARAVDAMVEGELEHCATRPMVDEAAWPVPPTRGQLACAASHCAAWRAGLDTAQKNLVVLEDDAELAPAFLEMLALILVDAPDDYDLIYLHVPTDRRQDTSQNVKLVPAYETTSLTAYVVSLRGAEKLIDKLNAAPLDAPVDLYVNKLAVDGTLTAFTVTDQDLARSRGDPSLAHHRLRYLPSTIADTPCWYESLC